MDNAIKRDEFNQRLDRLEDALKESFKESFNSLILIFETKLNAVDKKLDSTEKSLNGKISETKIQIEKMVGSRVSETELKFDKRIDNINTHRDGIFDKLDTKISVVEKDIEELRESQKKQDREIEEAGEKMIDEKKLKQSLILWFTLSFGSVGTMIFVGVAVNYISKFLGIKG